MKNEEYLWKTKDGLMLKPSDMSTDHIKNCIKLLYERINSLIQKYGCPSDSITEELMAHDRTSISLFRYGIEQFEKELKNRKNRQKLKKFNLINI